MTIEFAMFRYGIRFSAATYVLRVTVDAVDTSNLTFPATGSLDPNTDYFFSGDGGSTDLLQILEDCLDSHSSGGFSTVAVSLDAGSHEIEIDADASFLLRWSHASTTLDATIFGWENDADSDEDTHIESTNVPMGLVFLGRPVSDDTRPRQGVLGGLVRTLDGDVEATTLDDPYPDRSLSVSKLHRSIALDEYAPSIAPYATIESMHVRALSRGHRIHYVHDATQPLNYVVLKYVPPLKDTLERDESTQSRMLWKWMGDFVQLDSVGGGGAGGGSVPGGSGSSGAPIDASYVVMALNSTLTAERRLASGSGISITDGGANSDVTISALSGPDGALQDNLGRRWFGYHIGNGAGLDGYGLAGANTVGTLSHPTIADTNYQTSIRRYRYTTSGASTNRTARQTNPATGVVLRGGAAGRGGYYYVGRFGLSTSDANTSLFFGLMDASVAIGGASWSGTDEPTTEGDPIIGIGAETGDANLHVIHHAGGGTGTKTSLGASFAKTTNTTIWRIEFWCAANASGVSYRVTDESSGAVATGTISTDQPAATVSLFGFWWMSSKATNGHVVIEIPSILIRQQG